MARVIKSEDGKRSFRAQFSEDDFAMLDEACRVFGVGKSELVRRLVRASVDAGPALSAEGMDRVEALTGQVRIVGRNLMQVLRAIHRGEAVGIAESEPVWCGLHDLVAAIDGELSGLTASSGVALRERAGLAVVARADNEAT